jgi:hypothetical protein
MTLPPMAKGIRNSGGEGEALELLSVGALLLESEWPHDASHPKSFSTAIGSPM